MKFERKNISSNSPWEDIVGYSRAVKVGNHIYVSGTTAVDENGNIVAPGNPYKQTIQCIRNVEDALRKAESSLKDIVRIRIFVTDINNWEEISKGLSENFQSIKPAATMVEVSKLIAPELVVEIEADAIIIQ